MMAEGGQRFEPGTLWAKVRARTTHALLCGALHPISTRSELVEQGGVNFLVRVVANLVRKAQVKKDQRQSALGARTNQNPFLPYDPDLFVGDISDSHVCLLNKFNVLDHHILMVTRAFQEQESLLTLNDFEALVMCLAECEGLVFYNAGEAAGASQRHKHLQMVPLPFTPEVPQLPLETLIRTALVEETNIGVVPRLPFLHAMTRLNPEWIIPSGNGVHELHRRYVEMLWTVGLASPGTGGEASKPGPYNLLVTRQWMLLVPRFTECFADISVNALGFAGGFLVRDEEQLQRLKTVGPMTVLQRVALPSPAGSVES